MAHREAAEKGFHASSRARASKESIQTGEVHVERVRTRRRQTQRTGIESKEPEVSAVEERGEVRGRSRGLMC